ncbi:MAG TPA: heavy metal-responsive transcriptional regulator [Blastocatellia bacterium]|nr:heavy metal-responsive transcriptional regulator [Blastocatellia bacterium]
MSSDLTVGQLASAAGVSADTVRYYERLNLLPPASRTRAGYRLYTESDLERLRFIKQAQSLGLSLDDIRMLLPGSEAGLAECRRVRDLLISKLEELDARLGEMRAFRRRIVAYLKECEQALAGKREDRCPVLFEISHSTHSEAKPTKSRALRNRIDAKKGRKP